ncbi:hypothetical protein Poli38472_009390 [Pythium oligandrum]|uniref:Uncharacterized protein n=1 Tax=Pythium oligandrum TaxID=41045 RepID=A0A8K1CLN0_PYTOL|nr:hypothetical protein Poli38472_009390 [Pythium oligandrum]|eukprot:TMW65223.1 hypothetical protein Poli38472_009390 [Pythium oligandrum]
MVAVGSPDTTNASQSTDTGSAGSNAEGEWLVIDDVQSDSQEAEVLKDRTGTGDPVIKSAANASDTCTWYATQECVQPRSCFDCLNSVIDGHSCMIDSSGTCVTMDHYDSNLDFRKTYFANPYTQFPSINATYCRAKDPYCARCREAWDNPFGNSTLGSLPYCRGEAGCVCTRECEVEFRTENTIMQRCVWTSTYAGTSKRVFTAIGVMAGIMLASVVAAVITRLWVRRIAGRRGRGFPSREDRLPRREPSGPRLDLSGWRTMREKLIESENEMLRAQDAAKAGRAQVPANPTPALPVLVEEGDGYRPLSPSDTTHQQPQRTQPDAA